MRIPTLLEAFQHARIIDLSHTLEEQMPAYPTHATFSHKLVEAYQPSCHYKVTLSEHTGTHIDAPLHFIKGGKAIADMPISTFSGRALTIQATSLGPLGVLSKANIEAWEKENLPIQENDIVLIHFGWAAFWQSAPEKVLRDWPGISKEAAEYFVEKKVKIVGTDALAIDVFGVKDNPAHYELLGNDVLIVENLTNLHLLPVELYFVGFPLKIKNGSGSPIRAVAFIASDDSEENR